MLAVDLLGAGVEQKEVAGTVGVLGLALRQARLTERRGLLVTEDPGDRIPAEMPGSARSPYTSDELRISGSIDTGMPIAAQMSLVPVEGLEVHQQSA